MQGFRALIARHHGLGVSGNTKCVSIRLVLDPKDFQNLQGLKQHR